MFQLTAEELAGIVAVVVGFTELIKLSKYIPERYGLGIAAIVAALGILAYVSSKPELALNRQVIWPFVSAYLVVITAAAGVYGVVRESRGGDVTDASRTGFDGKRPPTSMIALLLIPSLLLLPACTRRNPDISPERSIALYATQVAGYLKETKTLADGLYKDQILPKAAYEKTLEVLLKANEAGVQLTSALQVYDTATDGVSKSDAAKQVDAALVTLGTLLPGVLTQITDANGRAKVGLLVESVQRLILVIARATLPRPTAELEPVLERIERRERALEFHRAFAN